MFLALLRAHFNPRYARAKIILGRAKNIFMPANVNSIVILINSNTYHLHGENEGRMAVVINLLKMTTLPKCSK